MNTGSGVKDAKDNKSGADATEYNSGISTDSFIFIKKILYLCTQKGARLGCASAIGASSIALFRP